MENKKTEFLINFTQGARNFPTLDFCHDVTDALKERKIDYFFVIFKPTIEKIINVHVLFEIDEENGSYLKKAINIASNNAKINKSTDHFFTNQILKDAFKAIKSQGLNFVLILFFQDKVKNLYFLENELSVITSRNILSQIQL